MVKMYRKAFTLIELVISIIAISIIGSFIFQSVNTVMGVQEEQKIITSASELKKTITQRLKDNEAIQHTIDNPDGITALDDSEVIIYDKLVFSPLIKDTIDGQGSELNDRKKAFWGIEEDAKIKYVYPIPRVHTTYYGKVPYTDFYIVILPSLLDKFFKADIELLKENLFEETMVEIPDPESTGSGTIEEIIGLNAKFNKEYNAENYPVLFSKLNESEFNKAKRQIVFFKVSTKDTIISRFERTIENLKSFAKNLQDWGSIQMSMYENIIISYGGSYNIGYFNSLGADTDSGSLDPYKTFSSEYVKGPNNIIRSANSGFSGEIDVGNTSYGIIVCNDEASCQEGMMPDSNIRTMEGLREESEGLLNISVDNSIALDSKKLMAGSKKIFGISENEIISNEFGSDYKIFLTNEENSSIFLNDVEVGTLSQNVPKNNSYAPYSATLYTVFPWIVQNELTDGDIQGYVAIKIFPELR